MNSEKLCNQAEVLFEAYRSLLVAYLSLKQVQERWEDQVSDYMREERFREKDAPTFLAESITELKAVIDPLQELAVAHDELCTYLQRVGRGESFSV